MPLKQEELAYLAGVYESTIGLKGGNTIHAAAISNTEAWPQYMAATFGGKAERFTSGKGKTYWGWFVPLKRRLELLTELQKAKALKALSVTEQNAIKAKLERAINKVEGE